MTSKSALLLINLTLGLSLLTSPVRAATVDTYDFEDVLVQPALMIQATISGSFSGVPDANGFISLSSLQSFTIGGVNAAPILFTFNVNSNQGGASSLGLVVSSLGIELCIGGPAASGGFVDGINCGPGELNGYASIVTGGAGGFLPLPYETESLPTLTLISSVNTPVPGTLPLLASILAAAGLLGWCKKRKDGFGSAIRRLSLSAR